MLNYSKITPTRLALLLAAVCLSSTSVLAEDTNASMVARSIDADAAVYGELAKKIWDLAEVGYQETQSSELLQAQLQQAGFTVKAGVADIPTAFVAEYGSGKPIIGILAEFDALPGVSQQATPERKAFDGKHAGHACGHHLFGTGSTAAAIAARQWLEQTGTSGTIRLYGTPAEEGGSGKVYMVRAGLFDDVDTVIHWHPGDRNAASPSTGLANRSAKFRFHGIASHAAVSPERGRSALDGVEAMNIMANMMREHIPSDARIHYVITNGGTAPNIVPEFAEVFYYVRAPSPQEVLPIWARLEAAARGAAEGTGTQVDWEIIHGNYNVLPNVTLAKVMNKNLQHFGGITYTAEEQEFAKALISNFEMPPTRALGSQETIDPFTTQIWKRKGSTDVGDVSWMAPTVGVRIATWVPGTSSHSWQAVAAGGTSIGTKGMLLAARTLAATAVDLFANPEVIAEARQEWLQQRGADFKYQPLLGDRAPPLNYRK
ncbi:MAG: aminobenzoyl-glutamate utilization protein B [Candidatus Azotimanducaceae bacterium]|jgi:aminobenzoyl-glutamate utilization protein B